MKTITNRETRYYIDIYTDILGDDTLVFLGDRKKDKILIKKEIFFSINKNEILKLKKEAGVNFKEFNLYIDNDMAEL